MISLKQNGDRVMAISADILNTFRPIDEEKIDNLLMAEIASDGKKIVVLDDDPTGTQTIHDIAVYTGWYKESVMDGFLGENKLFFILTNSRGFTEEETIKAHREIASVINEVSAETGTDYILISRSDSTLRGHFPLETEILREEIEKNSGKKIDGEILCPFFREGGRFTIGNVHYVRYGDELVPASETEFARDKTFGYSAAALPEYIEEKTGGRFRKEDVICISLDDLRSMDIDGITKQLEAAEDFRKIIVNAVDDSDIKVFCTALYRAMKNGKNYLLRTGAAVVRVICGNPYQPLLTREQMINCESEYGGVIVAGSHTAKTTAQLEALKERKDIEFIELDATLVRDKEAFEKEVARCLSLEEECIRDGRTVCCYTTRALITADTGDREDELRLSVRISEAVQSLVGKLSVTPAFVIAKGGITSSDIGTKALAVRKAYVLGQICPGIPVWRTGAESTFPGIPYVIFPGNVGEDRTLRDAADVLMGKD